MRTVVVVTLCSVLCSTVADAQQKKSAEVRTSALAAYAEGLHPRAAALFATAFAMEEDAELLFAWAQSERLSGDCDRALRLFVLYLASAPREENRAAARKAAATCGTLEEDSTATGSQVRARLRTLLREGVASDLWFAVALEIASKENACSAQAQSRIRLQRHGATEAMLAVFDAVRHCEQASNRGGERPRLQANGSSMPHQGAVFTATTNNDGKEAPGETTMRTHAFRYVGGVIALVGAAALYYGTSKVRTPSTTNLERFEEDIARGRRFQVGGGVLIGSAMIVLAYDLWLRGER